MNRSPYDQNIVIDLEFTPVALGRKGAKKRCEIIEIGAVRVSPEGCVLDEFRVLVRPQVAITVSGKVCRMTGITMHMLEDAPALEVALGLFAEWVGKGKTRMVAWSESDKAQMLSECAAKGIKMPFADARWMDLQRVFPRAVGLRRRRKRMSLHDAFAWFDRDLDKDCEHRALADAEHTAELLVALIKRDHIEHMRVMEEILSPKKQDCGYGIMAGALAGLYEKMCAVA